MYIIKELQKKDNKTSIEANRFVSVACFIAMICFFILWVLNFVGIFILDKTRFTILSFCTMFLSAIPLTMLYVFKLQARYVKYVIITIITIMIGIMYTFVSVHIVMGLVFPIITASIYVNKHLLKYSVIITFFMIFISHILAHTYSFTFDEPLTTLKGSLLYGACTRIILCSGMVFLAFKIVDITGETIKSVEVYSADIERNKNVMKKVLTESRKISLSSSVEELSKNMSMCINSVIGYITNSDVVNKAIIGMRMNDKSYRYIDEKQKLIEKQFLIEDGCIIVNCFNNDFRIAVYSEQKENNFEIKSDYLYMTFYEENILRCFLILDAKIEENDYISNDVMSIFYNTLKLDLLNARLTEEKISAQTELIMAFAEISESKSRQTGKHIKRVSEYMRVFGNHICIDKMECDALSIASMLHDIGKLMIPSEILEKPGKLTKEEFDIIKKHTKYGGDLLKNIPSRIMQIARNIAIYHHERWDGNGYAGIKGEDIDLYSRYVSVIDVFDALVSRRSYKEAWDLTDAYDEIIKNKGTQFAPEAVDLFIECYDDLVEVYKKYPDEKK